MKACLDACVLYPTVLREILVGCAAQGMYRPIWSPRILEEWARAAGKLGAEGEAVARREVAVLDAAWPAASVLPREGDLRRLHLPDADDVHVLASAVAGGADRLITFNAKDFPRSTLSEEGIERMDPDQFLRHLHGIVPEAVADVARAVHATAETLSGEAIPFGSLMKRARLPRLARAIERG